MTDIRLLVAGDPAQLTGGYRYDARMAEALGARGIEVRTTGLDGRFPDADATARESLTAALLQAPDRAVVVLDGLVMGGLPECIAPHCRRLTIVALVHHPLADEYGLETGVAARLRETEGRALAMARRVIVTSRFTARRLEGTYGVSREVLRVVEPGVDRCRAQARAAVGPLELLCVATLIPRKGHLILVDALARIADLPWECNLIGDAARDPVHARRVREAVVERGLTERVHLRGTVSQRDLRRAYENAYVLVLASFFEGYGMVVSEALACGLPVVATCGGALRETLPDEAGLRVEAGDAVALAYALRRMLVDPALRDQCARGARRAGDRLRTWQTAGDEFARALDLPTCGGPA